MKIVVKAILFAFYGALIAVALITTYGAIHGLVYGAWRTNTGEVRFPDWDGMGVGGVTTLVFVGLEAALFGAVAGSVFGAFVAYLASGRNIAGRSPPVIREPEFIEKRSGVTARPWQD
jgi:hypothetical protein